MDLDAVDVIVLAAGAGTRLGRGPKAHVLLGDATFLSRVVQACRDAGLGRIWVVGNAHDAHMAASCTALGVAPLVNREPERGMSSSIHAGLVAASERAGLEGVMVFPVDVTQVSPVTLAAIARGLAGQPRACVRPVCAGRHGHPVAVGADLMAPLIALGRDVPLRAGLVATGANMVDIDTDDPGVLSDIDVPADLEAAVLRRM